MTFPHGLRALDHREFRRFFAAQLVALIGSWMQTVAQSWLIIGSISEAWGVSRAFLSMGSFARWRA